MNTDKIELYCQNLISDEALMLINYLNKIDTWYKATEPLDDNHGVADDTKINMTLEHVIGYNKLYVSIKLIEDSINPYLGIMLTIDFKYDDDSTDHLGTYSENASTEYIDFSEWAKFKTEFISCLNHHMEVLKFNKLTRLNPDDVDEVFECNTVEEEPKEEVKEETTDDV